MTADELRELADALEPMACAPRFDGLGVPALTAYLRACADALDFGPVAWRMLRKDDGFVLGLSTVMYPEHRLDAAAKGGCEGQPLYPLAMPGALRMPEPMTDDEISDLARETVKGNKSANWLARAIEAEVLRRVKEANE